MNNFWNLPAWANLTDSQKVLAVFLRASALGLDWHSQAALRLRQDAKLDDTAVIAFNKDLTIAHAMVV